MAAESNMTNSSMFDELSSRMNQQKRPDSGIHNSTELHHNEVEKQNDLLVSGEANRQEYRDGDDSGQESSDQLDSSMNVSGGSKKKGFLNNFKKMFKKKKNSSKTPGENNKKKDKKLDDQFRASSEPDVLADKPIRSIHQQQQPQQQQAPGFKRSNTEASMTPRREKPPRTFTVKARAVVSNDQNDDHNTVNDLHMFLPPLVL